MYVRRSVLGVVMCALASSSAAVDESRLWLPVKDQIYYLQLKKAASAAEQLGRCTKVLEGTIDREQSKPEHPIFRILCMQATGRNYNEMVDGVTFETLTTYIPIVEEPTEEEHESKKRIRFGLCHSALKSKTEFMTDLKWYFESYLEPTSYDGEVAVFQFDFDASNPSGDTLEYRAYCSSDALTPPKIRIKKRPKPEPAE